MAAKRECVALVLDVGPRMHPHLAHAARAACDFLTQKMLHRPNDQVCLLLFGASETRNREADASAAEPGGEGEYAHIVEAHDLAHPDGGYLRTLHTLRPGAGRSDFKEALAVAAAVLVGPQTDGARRRIVLLSNLCERAQDDPDDELGGCLAEGLQRREVQLDAVLLDVPEDDLRHNQDKTYNLNQLAAICQEVSHRQRSFPSALALCGAFPAREVAPRAYYAGPLSIGSQLHIRVKTCVKTAKEKLPAPGKESVHAAEAPEGVVGGIVRDKEYYYVDQEEHGEDQVPESEVRQALRYGCNLVPLEEGQERALAFPTQKGIKLLGFLPWDTVPRHLYMGKVDALAADKASEGSRVALAALVAALLRRRQKAVLRCVLRERGRVVLCLATPVAGGGAAPPHLLLNELPFMEDLRGYGFPSFAKKAWAPSDSQLEAAATLVASMRLGGGGLAGDEQLLPERTPDPVLHRLYWECGRRAVDPQAELQHEDELAQEVLEPHLERFQPAGAAAAALAAAAAAFPMHQAARASRRAAIRIGADSAREDYERLLQEGGDAHDLLEALGAAVTDLVFGSAGASRAAAGAGLVDFLREQCVAHDQAEQFNAFLEAAHRRCRDDESKGEFWRALSRREVKKIANDEASTQLEPSQAQEWYTQKAWQ